MCDLHINTRIYGDGAPSPAYIDRSFPAISVFPSLHPYPPLSTYLSLALVRYIYIYTYMLPSLYIYLALV